MLVEVIESRGPRARLICDALMHGIRICGDGARHSMEEYYNGPTVDVAAFYGLYGKIREAFTHYRKPPRKAVYVDLGYWKRTEGGKLTGYHKIAVNSRHPTAYFQNRDYPSIRFKMMGVPIKPWNKTGRHILVAGMGAKAADVEGFKPTQWEEAAIREIRRYTDRPIIYRPKPSWRNCTEIEGTIFSGKDQRLEEVLEDCHAVVSHHSNVCVDAILAGIPSFCWHGVATPMSLRELALIESPIYPDGREQWAYNIAWTQWTPAEIKSGAAWRYLKDEGIL